MNKSRYSEEFLHKIVWQRFIRRPYGHVLDYTDKDGNVYFPTSEECVKSMPNPFGRWTPITNGAMFTGLYAYALIEKYNKYKDKKTAEDIEILINGLFLLQDVGNVEGFIARGVADDGKSHYPFSSEDQFVPWVMALYEYYKCDLCNNKENIKNRLLRALIALRDYNWKMPCDAENLYMSGWSETQGWRGVVKMLYCARIIFELTNDENDLIIFNNLLNGKPEDCIYKRLEIISHGFSHDMITSFGKQTWICVCAHLAVRELLSLDKDNTKYYKQCLYNNGVTALKSVDDINKYDNKSDGFNIDWRAINDLWEDYSGNIQTGNNISYRQLPYWEKEFVPHRHMEHSVLGEGLFAAWVAVTSEDNRIKEKALEKLKSNCKNVDWDSLHMSYAFVAESALIFSMNKIF